MSDTALETLGQRLDSLTWGIETLCRTLRDRQADALQPDPPTVELGPGVHHLYRHFAADGALLYVGVSLSALFRLGTHRRKAAWYWRVARVEITGYASREHALIAERNAIRREHPRHNIVHARKA